MDPTRFESFLTILAAAPTRRTALRVLSSFGVSLMIGPIPVLSKNKGKGKGCKKGQKKCGKKCIAKAACCTNDDCNRCALEVCVNGTCDCAEGAERSNGVCGVDPLCVPSGGILDYSDRAGCCSGNSFYDPDSGQTRCLPGTTRCVAPTDCSAFFNGGLELCRGFMCPELYFSTLGVPCTPA